MKQKDKKPKPPKRSVARSKKKSASRARKAPLPLECLTIFEPEPPSSKNSSKVSGMLMPSEIEQLRQKDKEASIYAQKVFKKKPMTPPPDKSESSETPSEPYPAIVEPSPVYLVPVPRSSSPQRKPMKDSALDSASMPVKTITLMADFGNGPYAWLKDASDESEWVGGNIADAVGGFGDEYGVPAELEKQFADWVILFEREYKNPEFDWNTFHREGIVLCRRLKQALGNAYRVVYVKPHEDPNYRTNRRTEIFL